MIGEFLIRSNKIWLITFGVIIGSIIYKAIIYSRKNISMLILELISKPKLPKKPVIALSAFVTAVSYLLLGSGTKLVFIEGLIYAMMVLGVFMTFRILDFPDMKYVYKNFYINK